MPRNEAEIQAVIDELSSHGFGGIQPTEAQVRALLEADRDGPLQFLNLLAYHPLARYPEGHELADAGLTGRQAYDRYGMVALQHVVERGGRLALYNDVEQVIIGAGDQWDQVAIMEYASTEAFVDMIRDPAYTAALPHRDAGLAETVVLVTRSLLPPG